MEGFKTALILPDCHINDIDIRAYCLALEVGAFLCVDEIVLLGDYADYYCISDHPKTLGRNIPTLLEREVDCVNHYLNDLDKSFSSAQKIFIEGNHEYRLTRYLQNRCPELFGYIDAPHLFELDKRPKWQWIPYGPEQKHSVLGSKLYARHEPIGRTALSTAQKAMCSIVFAHIHRKDLGEVVAISGERYKAFCPGWLGNKKALTMQYVKNHHQWSHGFCVAFVNPVTRFFYADIVDILEDYSCIFQGKEFRA